MQIIVIIMVMLMVEMKIVIAVVVLGENYHLSELQYPQKLQGTPLHSPESPGF